MKIVATYIVMVVNEDHYKQDHKTLKLNGWHKILMNTEKRDRKGRTLIFID